MEKFNVFQTVWLAIRLEKCYNIKISNNNYRVGMGCDMDLVFVEKTERITFLMNRKKIWTA